MKLEGFLIANNIWRIYFAKTFRKYKGNHNLKQIKTEKTSFTEHMH